MRFEFLKKYNMKNFLLTLVLLVSANSYAQIIITNDTIICGSFNDTLYALSSDPSGITADDGHGPIVDIGFTFNFYGAAHTQLVISGNGYITFDLFQANQYSPWSINAPIPNPGNLPENAIMGPWHDLNPGVGGSIVYGVVGVAPNRKFIVTWCGVPMYSCTNLLHTSQVVLYEGSDKIEMFIENKPLCASWNSGDGIHGLVDETSTNFDIVDDPVLLAPRNMGLQWTAVNEGWEFIPNNPATSYTINSIVYVPIIAGPTTWTDANGNILGTGPSLPVNVSTTTTYFASMSGSCSFGSLVDSVQITVPACFNLALSSVSASCFGDDAEITCQPDTLLPSWQCELYDLSGVNLATIPNLSASSHTFYNLLPGTYVIKVQSGISTTEDTIVVGQIQNLLTFQNNIQESNCLDEDGAITITPDQQFINYPWDITLANIIGDTLQNINQLNTSFFEFSNMVTGEYIVSILDAAGCIFVDTLDLNPVPNPLIMETNVSHVSCYGLSDGEIGVFLDNGLLPYTFYINGVENLNPPPYDSLFTGLSEGVYIITVADSDSCGLTETIYIDAPQFPLQVLSSNSVVICDTSLGGSAYAYAAGGSPYPDGTYIFEWYNTNWGSITVGDSISNLGVGDYFLEVTDSNGCQENIPITVTAPQLPLSITPQLFGVVCTGDSDGAAVVFTGGGSAPYDYVWSDMLGNALDSANNIVLGDTLSGLFAGSYHLMVTDNSGCTEEIFFNIGEPSIALEIGAVLVVDSIDCYGDQDGRGIVYMVNGSGSPGYSYLWDNGEIDSIANALSGGWHTVAVSDIRGCVVEDSVYIPENSEIKSNLTITNPISCYGDNDGAIYVSTQGGIQLLNAPNYDYFWSNGDTDIVLIDSLTHGSYYLTTRDSLGCVVVDSITIDNPDPLYVNAQEMLEVSCYGYSTGNAYAIGYGGTLPYIFSWITNGIIDSSSNDSSIVTTLFAGLETVQLTDVRGCIATDTVSIHQPDPLIVSISDSVLAYCVGVNTASATASVSGGTAPYIYEWDDNSVFPQLTVTASNLYAGIYTVTVIDYRGCEAAYTVDLTSYSAPLSATINSFGPSGNSVSCYGSTDGALTVEIDIINSGTPPYIYQWFGSSVISANDSIFNLSAGGYSVTVTDANGCLANTNQQLTSPAPLLYDVISADNTTCLGACDGELTLNIQGGITPYTAQLLNNQSGSSAINNVATNTLVTGVCTGDYTVLVQDFNACDAVLMLGGSDQAVLDTTITTDVSVAVIQDVDCYGSSTGEVAILAPQTALFYSYIWLDLNGDTISAATTIDSLLAGDYILHAAYETINGCTTVDTVTVSQNSLIYSNAIVTDASCNGYNDGSIITTTFGGVSPYSYSWSPIPSSLNNALNVPAGSYDLTITDASNCSVIESYNVAAPALLTAAVTASQTYILNTSVAGGTPPYSYSWIEQTQTGVILGTSSSYIVGSNGTYYVVVTDANNCTSQSNSTTYLETGTLDLVSSINLNIYPNPFKDEATVDFGQKINKARIKIFDTYGKLVERHELADTDKYIIQRMNKSSGVYFIEIEINQTRLNSKIIIK